MNTAAMTDDRPAAASDAKQLDPDVLAAVIEETARRVEARAARPSPIHLRSWQEIERFAEKAARSGMVPKDFASRPDAICIAVQMGSELGLAPMQALQNIAVINGRPAVWGDAMVALVRASPLCDDIQETFEGEGDAMTAVCVAKRVGKKPVVQRFSVADAKRAKLWEKPIWQQYPDRMLQMRARGFALRDAFPDVLKGLLSAEEARDIPWEDTGLSIVPPVATDAPIRAVAATTPRAPKVVDPTVYETASEQPERTDEQWRAWLVKLNAACKAVYHRSDVEEIGNRDTVRTAASKGPDWVKQEISEILHENYARLPAEAELPEVAIAGEANLAAG